jgi:hypothetical protein
MRSSGGSGPEVFDGNLDHAAEGYSRLAIPAFRPESPRQTMKTQVTVRSIAQSAGVSP